MAHDDPTFDVEAPLLDHLPTFRPLPLLGNPHVQTVVANFLSWTRDALRATPHLVPVTDGDAIMLHESTPESWRPDHACALLVHGLGGSHRSPYLRRVANRLLRHGMRVYRMDLRGAGAGMLHARKIYNAASSPDVRTALEWIHQQNPSSRLVVAGFSLGGGITLKAAGEASNDPIPGLAAVAAVAAPLDLARCAEMIARFPLYDRFYVKTLIRQLQIRQRVMADLPPLPPFSRRCTVREFDEIFTAPRGGYGSVAEYYAKASALSWVPKISVPLFLLTSRDDPFIDGASYADLPPRERVETVIAPGGGHLGFLGADGLGGFRWAEARLCHWILRQGESA